MKKIRISESELKSLIIESVKSYLKEATDPKVDSLLMKLNSALGAETVCERLISRIGNDAAYKMLNDIYMTEVAPYANDEDEEMI